MVQENLDLIFTIIWSFAIANTVGAGLKKRHSAAHLGSLPPPGSGHSGHYFFWRLPELPKLRRSLCHARVGTPGLAHEATGLAARPFPRRLRPDQADRTVPVAIDQPLRPGTAAPGPG